MTTIHFNVEFGKIRRAPGAPKNAPRWVYRCLCGACDGIAGPFSTRREAEAAAKKASIDFAIAIDESAGSVKH